MIRLTQAGESYGRERVQWIFEAEQRAMEDTDPQEVQASIAMLEKYIQRFRKELEGAAPLLKKDDE